MDPVKNGATGSPYEARHLVRAVALALLGIAWAVAVLGADDVPPSADIEVLIRDDLAASDVARRLEVALLDSLPRSPQVQDYVGYALLHNEQLRAAVLQRRALSTRESQVSGLPDLQFRWSEYLVPVETRVGPQQRMFGLFQTFPWFGTLSQKGQVERERAAAAEARVSAVALGIAARVRRAYYELVFLASAVAINEEHLRLLTQWEEVARSRYATGGGSYADVIKAQVEIGKLTDRVAELRDRYRPLTADLNAELNRPGDAAADWPGPVVAEGRAISEDELRERLAAENPELISLRHEALRFERAEVVAGKQGMPAFNLGLSYIQTGNAAMPGVADSGKDPVIASLGVSIPLWRGQYDAAEQEAASNYLAVHATRKDRANVLGAALERALFGYRDAVRKLDLYADTLLPKGEQSLQATRAAYETGKAGFLDLVDAERVLLEFELAEARASVDLMINLAEIEKLVGGPVHPGGADPWRQGHGNEER